jgi:hypothetical protein
MTCCPGSNFAKDIAFTVWSESFSMLQLLLAGVSLALTAFAIGGGAIGRRARRD